nr:uncharacterized protein LOC112696826 [Arachis hypogaea]
MVSGLTLSRARAPSLPSSLPAAEAAGPGTGRRRCSLSRHRLAVSPAPSLCSSLPEAEAAGPGLPSSRQLPPRHQLPRRRQLPPRRQLLPRNQKLVPIWPNSTMRKVFQNTGSE